MNPPDKTQKKSLRNQNEKQSYPIQKRPETALPAPKKNNDDTGSDEPPKEVYLLSPPGIVPPTGNPVLIPSFGEDGKQKKLAELWQLQEKLLRGFGSNPVLPQLPPWATPIPDITQTKNDELAHLNESQMAIQSQMEINIKQRQSRFQDKCHEIESKELQIKQTHTASTINGVFDPELRMIETKGKEIEIRFKKTQETIQSIEKMFQNNNQNH